MIELPTRVLVVDDADGVRDLLCTLLDCEEDFVVVGRAGDGREAIAVAGSTQPDLVVLDLAMPVMDGVTALPGIRRAAPAARVAVLSGFSTLALERAAREAGADAYLEKGMGAATLVERLRVVARGPRPGAEPTVRLGSPHPGRGEGAAAPEGGSRARRGPGQPLG